MPAFVDLEEVQEENHNVQGPEKPLNEHNEAHGDSEENRTKIQNEGNIEGEGSRTNSEDDSENSEFVEATQHIDDEDNSEAQEVTSNTPDRVQKDISFLRNSWENLADQDANEVISKQIKE